MDKKRLFLTIAEALSGVLGVIALVGNFALDAKESKAEVKQIGAKTDESSKN